MKIYHYTNYSTFKHIFKGLNLKYGNFKETNDPTEFIRYSSVPYSTLIQIDKALVFKPFYTKVHGYKPLCFSVDGDQRLGWQLPCMWAHYGDNHKGVCIELDLERILKDDILHDKIKYLKNIPVCGFMDNITGNEKNISEIVENYISQNINTLFFTKEDVWNYEQEYRLVKETEDEFLDIKNAITGVYLGARFKTSIKTVQSHINSASDSAIIIYNMRMNETNKLQVLERLDISAYKKSVELNKGILRRYKIKLSLLHKESKKRIQFIE